MMNGDWWWQMINRLVMIDNDDYDKHCISTRWNKKEIKFTSCMVSAAFFGENFIWVIASSIGNLLTWRRENKKEFKNLQQFIKIKFKMHHDICELFLWKIPEKQQHSSFLAYLLCYVCNGRFSEIKDKTWVILQFGMKYFIWKGFYIIVYILLCHIMFIVLYCTCICNNILYYIILYYIILYYIILFYIILYYIILCYI